MSKAFFLLVLLAIFAYATAKPIVVAVYESPEPPSKLEPTTAKFYRANVLDKKLPKYVPAEMAAALPSRKTPVSGMFVPQFKTGKDTNVLPQGQLFRARIAEIKTPPQLQKVKMQNNVFKKGAQAKAAAAKVAATTAAKSAAKTTKAQVKKAAKTQVKKAAKKEAKKAAKTQVKKVAKAQVKKAAKEEVKKQIKKLLASTKAQTKAVIKKVIGAKIPAAKAPATSTSATACLAARARDEKIAKARLARAIKIIKSKVAKDQGFGQDLFKKATAKLAELKKLPACK